MSVWWMLTKTKTNKYICWNFNLKFCFIASIGYTSIGEASMRCIQQQRYQKYKENPNKVNKYRLARILLRSM